MKQILFGFIKNDKSKFGGSLLVGKRKSRRPLSTKAPIHLILKAHEKSVFNPGNRKLEKIIHQTAQHFHMKVHDLALNWSHIHLLIQIRDRQDYIRFIRAITSLLAKAVKKSDPKTTKLFTLRPFTRILNWGKDLKNAFEYRKINQMESFGMLRRKKSGRIRREELKMSRISSEDSKPH